MPVTMLLMWVVLMLLLMYDDDGDNGQAEVKLDEMSWEPFTSDQIRSDCINSD